MKIILNEDVYNLGEEGDVCTVADGYARNFLLPKKLAVPYNTTNIAYFKSRAAAIAKKKEDKRKAALSLKDKIEELNVEIRVSAGDSGKLFGAVTAATIVEALSKEGIHVEKKKVDVPSHNIKMVGIYTVQIRLYENESAALKINVVNEREAELSEKAEKRAAKIAAEEEAKAAAAAAEAVAAAEAAPVEQAEEVVSEEEPSEEE